MSPTKVQSTAAEVCSLIASQVRGGCLHDPAHPGVGGMCLHPLTPLQRLAEEAQAQQACPSRSTVLECYKDFADVFSEEAFTHIRKCWVRGNRALRGLGGLKAPRGLRAQRDKP